MALFKFFYCICIILCVHVLAYKWETWVFVHCCIAKCTDWLVAMSVCVLLLLFVFAVWCRWVCRQPLEWPSERPAWQTVVSRGSADFQQGSALCCRVLSHLNDKKYTLCSEKNTHSRFLLYLHGECLDLYKIFRECLRWMKYYIDIKVTYSLLPVTSLWRHIYMFVHGFTHGFYHWENAWESARVMEPHVCVRCFWADNGMLMEWKL